MANKSSVSKRNFIKTAAIMAGGGGAIAKLADGVEAKTDYWDLFVENDDTWVKNNYTSVTEQYSISEDETYALSSSVKSFGGCPSDRGGWLIHFENNNIGRVHRHPYDGGPEDGYKMDRIGYQTVNVSDPGDSSDSQLIEFTKDGQYTGGGPAEDTNDSLEGDVVELVISESLNLLNSNFGLALNASKIAAEAFYDWAVEESTPDEYYELQWNYADGYTGKQTHPEVKNYIGWGFEMDWDSTATHYVNARIKTKGKGLEVHENVKIEVTSPSSDQCSGGTRSLTDPKEMGAYSDSSTSQNSEGEFDPMSQQDDCTRGPPPWAKDVSNAPEEFKKKYGLRKVPIDILERAGFDPDRLQTDGDKAWWASSIPTKVTMTGKANRNDRATENST